MNTVQGFGTILSILFIHEKKLHSISSTLLCSTDLSLISISFSLFSSKFYNATTNYLRTGSMSSRRHVCNLSYQTLSSYLLCPITITNSYCQIRVNTQYLQPLTVLHDFTNMTYLKMLLSKYLNNSIYSLVNF
jgi:hypothetical protein